MTSLVEEMQRRRAEEGLRLSKATKLRIKGAVAKAGCDMEVVLQLMGPPVQAGTGLSNANICEHPMFT